VFSWQSLEAREVALCSIQSVVALNLYSLGTQKSAKGCGRVESLGYGFQNSPSVNADRLTLASFPVGVFKGESAIGWRESGK
jgi:hypothetical protein